MGTVLLQLADLRGVSLTSALPLAATALLCAATRSALLVCLKGEHREPEPISSWGSWQLQGYSLGLALPLPWSSAWFSGRWLAQHRFPGRAAELLLRAGSSWSTAHTCLASRGKGLLRSEGQIGFVGLECIFLSEQEIRGSTGSVISSPQCAAATNCPKGTHLSCSSVGQ